ncbi:hypothetical protein BBO99_00007821 [Phytophthora kernoviae]|uniref:Uncharacterized protein n=2 Tax=Phytophthora kernoviae TaxID=325452 RepID=A0A3R7JQF4_9STRA|nr:hypothetical protein G195_011452 [Phytophthora kernoviae 00238/432]KAG2502664.1 hypothetical protein JM18_009829 [Phytophthora kernoviae]KAG2502772.1 hypothetical protein JM16_009622 [Phytophthora kernoviae]RLN26503.1 hypothetical protein BBI17_007801 [Phytophthora kernoviae]RLN76088.1 hypothetical protein BBO99_00007821 [Phytophthora kernoviae]
MSGFFLQTITSAIPLTKELKSLFEFQAHQKPSLATGDREFNELAQLSEKELDVKIRELENWNFRLNLDEGVSQHEVHLMFATVRLDRPE